MRNLFYVILIALGLFTTLNSCKKDKKTSPPSPPAGALQLWSNVHIIDSTQWILYVNGVHPANGIYMYSFTPSTPNVNVNVGDILVGTANGGYIRKVTSISIQGAYYVLQTSQAVMSDVFKTGSFNFQIPINDSTQGNQGVARTLSNFSLFHSSNYDLTLVNGQFNIQPTCNFSFSFDSTAGLTNFQMSTANTVANYNVTFNMKGVLPTVWSNNNLALGSYAINNTQLVQVWTSTGNISVPVVIKLTLDYLANTWGGSPHLDTINTTLNWTSSDIYTGGLQYQGQWQPIHSWTTSNYVGFDTLTKGYNSVAKLTFLSQISSSFYSIGGPQITIGLIGDFNQLQQGTTAPFDHRTDGWSTATDAQTVNPVFANGMGTFTQSWNSDSAFYQAPYLVAKTSGDNQTGNVVQTLPEPLVVKVTDSNGQPVSNVAVKFAVTNGGGTLSAYNLLTDQNGAAQVTWTLGIPMGNQNVTVTAYDGFNHLLNGTPAVFNATGQ